MIILTGGAGFVGSNLLGALNARGVTDVLVVDRLGDNFRNLCDLRFSDFMQPGEFIRAIERKTLPDRIEAIFHQGACTDTTCEDGRYMIEVDSALRPLERSSAGVRVKRSRVRFIERVRAVARKRTAAQPLRAIQTGFRQSR